MKPLPAHIERYDRKDKCDCEASLFDWFSFYRVRDVSDFDILGTAVFPGRYSSWKPICGSWDLLEGDLFELWGSVVQRWYPPDPLPFACLVCKDKKTDCPICEPLNEDDQPWQQKSLFNTRK